MPYPIIYPREPVYRHPLLVAVQALAHAQYEAGGPADIELRLAPVAYRQLVAELVDYSSPRPMNLRPWEGPVDPRLLVSYTGGTVTVRPTEPT